MDYLSAGLQLGSMLSSYNADKASSKASRAIQAYNNAMVQLSNSVNQNAITQNELLAQQAFNQQAIQLQRGSILTQARVEVSAAAAGVKGRSVNQALFNVQRNAANQERQRQLSLRNANLAFDQQRVQSAMSAAMQTDHSYIPKPKFGTYLLKAASSMYGSMDFGGSGGSNGSGFMSGLKEATAVRLNRAGYGNLAYDMLDGL